MKALRILPLVGLSMTPLVLGVGATPDDPPGRAIEESLKAPAPLDDGDVQVLEGWEQNECAECHREIAAEWAGTRHATAWVHDHYQRESARKRRPESCYGCHVPTPIHVGDRFGRKPLPRGEDENRHEGVTCRSCHEGAGGEMLGPWGAEQEAHTSAAGEHFADAAATNALCINCHETTIGPVIGIAKDFELTDQGERGLSCVGCHMAPVERAIAAVEGRELSPRVGRSHALQTPRDPAYLALAFGIDARREGSVLLISIANRTGHRVPGLTERTLTFEARPLAGGKPLGEATTLELTSRAYLPVDEQQELRVALPTGTDSVRLHARHDAPGLSDVVFVDMAFPIEG